MAGKKQALARVLRHSGFLGMHRVLFSRLHRRRLVIFNYHRLLPDDPGHEPNFERDVYHTTASNFEAQVRWLQRHTELISQERLLAHLAGTRPYRGRRTASMITFDDGYADNYDIAFPVLKRLGAPATLFVTTGMVDQGRVGWWDIIAWLLRESRRPTLELDGHEFILPDQFRNAADHFQQRMKLEPASQTSGLLDRLAEACGVELPALEDQQREVLTWDQIREMSAGGVAVGAHTHSHRVLATLSQEEQEEELAASKEVLEAQLGTQVQTLAYPVGGEAHINESTTALARRLGYRAAFTYLTGHNVWGSMDPYRVRRTEGPSRVDLMAGLTTLPRLFNTIQ